MVHHGLQRLPVCSNIVNFKFKYVLYRDENEIVPQVLEAVLSLPSTAHVAVRYSSVQLIGELCEWIERHPQYLGELTHTAEKQFCVFMERILPGTVQL